MIFADKRIFLIVRDLFYAGDGSPLFCLGEGLKIYYLIENEKE